MAYFATLKTIKVNTQVTIMFHPYKRKTSLSAFFTAVGLFLKNWCSKCDEWELKPDCNEYDDPIIRFCANLENVPALAYGPSDVTLLMRGAENWKWDDKTDSWFFTKNRDLADELANYYFNDFAEFCGYAAPEKLGFDDTGFEVECGLPYVSEMKGVATIAESSSASRSSAGTNTVEG